MKGNGDGKQAPSGETLTTTVLGALGVDNELEGLKRLTMLATVPVVLTIVARPTGYLNMSVMGTDKADLVIDVIEKALASFKEQLEEAKKVPTSEG